MREGEEKRRGGDGEGGREKKIKEENERRGRTPSPSYSLPRSCITMMLHREIHLGERGRERRR